MDAYTTLAIEAFILVERKRLQLEKAELLLEAAVVKVPKKDMAEYARETEKAVVAIEANQLGQLVQRLRDKSERRHEAARRERAKRR